MVLLLMSSLHFHVLFLHSEDTTEVWKQGRHFEMQTLSDNILNYTYPAVGWLG